ncbi:membrane protein [Bryocella elongata]|uniref:Membrane protein n=1 Tax=Bryocella elongata TaxID=863522 RepID=A0A1H6AFI6_9BACT|nr:YihY/virulence factor BrkB family protein [Bryocella elongata]SEG47251.1 membrane protein [Bryocella elongata]
MLSSDSASTKTQPAIEIGPARELAPAIAPAIPTAHAPVNAKDHTIAHVDPWAQRIWDRVSHSPLHSLWDLQGVPPSLIAKRTLAALLDDNLLSRAAEMGYYFLFALFPTLVCASALLGLVARRAGEFYDHLLQYLALVVPHTAYSMVIDTFNQTTAAATRGKLTFGIVAALWSASVGFSAMQDGMNTVYKVKETRPYWKARGAAILVTTLLSLLVTGNLAVLLVGDAAARFAHLRIHHHWLEWTAIVLIHTVATVVALALLMLLFAVIYYFAPDLKNKVWRWLTPGAALGISGWLLTSIGLRIYLHYFDTYSLTYGSLGAVIVLLTWFYLSGLMLLLGAEVNSEIEAAVAERGMKREGAIPQQVSAEPGTQPTM